MTFIKAKTGHHQQLHKGGGPHDGRRQRQAADMPLNRRFGVIMRYAGRRLPRRAAGAVYQMLHPALDGKVGDGYPVAHLLLIGYRPARRAGLHAEDAVDPGHRRPHCRPVFKGAHDQLGSPRRQRDSPGGERIPDQRPHSPAAVQQRPRHRAALLAGGAKNQYDLGIIHHRSPSSADRSPASRQRYSPGLSSSSQPQEGPAKCPVNHWA